MFWVWFLDDQVINTPFQLYQKYFVIDKIEIKGTPYFQLENGGIAPSSWFLQPNGKVIFGLIRNNIGIDSVSKKIRFREVEFIDFPFKISDIYTNVEIEILENLRKNLIRVIDSSGTMYILMKEEFLGFEARAQIIRESSYILGISKEVPKTGKNINFQEWIMYGIDPEHSFMKGRTVGRTLERTIKVLQIFQIGENVFEIKGECFLLEKEVFLILNVKP